MIAMEQCPFCGGDRNKSIDGAKKALRLRGIRSAHADPGGASFEMDDGTKLRLTSECNACDEQAIWRFLLKN